MSYDMSDPENFLYPNRAEECGEDITRLFEEVENHIRDHITRHVIVNSNNGPVTVIRNNGFKGLNGYHSGARMKYAVECDCGFKREIDIYIITALPRYMGDIIDRFVKGMNDTYMSIGTEMPEPLVIGKKLNMEYDSENSEPEVISENPKVEPKRRRVTAITFLEV